MSKKFYKPGLLVLSVILIGGLFFVFFLRQNIRREKGIAFKNVFSKLESYEYVLMDNETEKAVGGLFFTINQPTGSSLSIQGKTTVDGLVITEYKVELNPKSLKPVTSHMEYKGKNREDVYVVDSVFKPEVISVKAKGPEGTEDLTVVTPTDTYENSSLLNVLRGMDFTLNKPFQIFDYLPHLKALLKMNVKVLAEEDVEVPAGKYKAYHVIIDFENINGEIFTHHVWYDTSPPHVLVKYLRSDIQYQLKKIQ